MSENHRAFSGTQTLHLAAVQCVSEVGDAAGNLARAERLIGEAAGIGAQLVICPEFLTPGYIFDRVLWKYAEPRGGRTERWLCELAARHGFYLGAGYLEVDGEDFWNTFALASPSGAILGRVRKQSLPAFEGWVFRSSELPKTFATPLGRIAVGICNDNHTRAFFMRMRDEQPDLLLMPHSAPFPGALAEPMRSSVADIAPFYARSFGIPCVVANKAAAATSCKTPIPGLLPLRLSLTFPGMSTIADSDGRVLARLPDVEGIVSAEVMLAPLRKRIPEAPPVSYWSQPPRSAAHAAGAVFRGLEWCGKRAYHGARKQRLAAIEALRSTSLLGASSSKDTATRY